MQDYIPRKIDINEQLPTVVVKQFDNLSRFIHIQIFDKDLPDLPDDEKYFNLENCTSRLYVQPKGDDSGTNVEYIDGEVADDEHGIVTFLLPSSVTETAGNYEGEIWIYGAESSRPIISTKSFNFVVEKSIRNNTAIEGTSKFTALDNVLSSNDLMRARMTALIASPAGSGGDVGTELRDIRTGYNGNTYDSAGNAVRTQISDIYTNRRAATNAEIAAAMDEDYDENEEIAAVLNDLQRILGNAETFQFQIDQVGRRIDNIGDNLPTIGYVTPEMYGAKGDGVTDDTAALIDVIEDGRPVVGVGIYRITGTVFLTGGFRCNPGSMIRLDFDGDFGVVIGGDETDYDNTQYNFDVDITVDCNSRTFSTAAVALNAVKRSHIKLRGVNCSGTFFRDVYGANGSNYENYIDINAIGTGAAGSVCALLHSSDNNYNQIISRDFETCVLLDTGSSQNINCVHGWLSSDAIGLWENSKLIAVAKNGSEAVMPRLVFSFIYQDTMRYGFHLGENRIEAYGGFWFSAVNSGVIPYATRESYPIVSFYGEEVGTPSLIRADFHEFYSNPMTISDKRALIFNGTINPQRTGLNYAYSDANAVPMGNTVVALQAGASNAPASAGESTLVQFNSLRQTVQMAVLADNSTHIRKKGTWDSSWGGWTEIYPGAPTSGALTIPAQADENNPDIVIGSVNFCSKVNRVLEFSLVLTVNAAARNSVIAILPEGYRPLMNYQDVCFGLSGHQFLDIRTDGNIYFRCDAGEDIASTTVLRIHSVCVCG